MIRVSCWPARTAISWWLERRGPIRFLTAYTPRISAKAPRLATSHRMPLVFPIFIALSSICGRSTGLFTLFAARPPPPPSACPSASIFTTAWVPSRPSRWSALSPAITTCTSLRSLRSSSLHPKCGWDAEASFRPRLKSSFLLRIFAGSARRSAGSWNSCECVRISSLDCLSLLWWLLFCRLLRVCYWRSLLFLSGSSARRFFCSADP